MASKVEPSAPGRRRALRSVSKKQRRPSTPSASAIEAAKTLFPVPAAPRTAITRRRWSGRRLSGLILLEDPSFWAGVLMARRKGMGKADVRKTGGPSEKNAPSSYETPVTSQCHRPFSVS